MENEISELSNRNDDIELFFADIKSTERHSEYV